MAKVKLGVVAVVAAGVMVAAGCSSMFTERFSDDSAIDAAVRKVRVVDGVGSVSIRTGDVPVVRRTVRHTGDRPGATHRVEGDALVLEGCGGERCWVEYEVVVPRGSTVAGDVMSGDVTVEGVASVDLRASSGDVVVRRVAGAVNVAVSSGSVELTEVGERVNVEAASGDVTVRDVAAVNVRATSGRVEATGVAGEVDVEVQSGDVVVRLVEAGSVRAHASSGNIDVTVPRGPYRLALSAGSGAVDSSVADDAGAADRLELAASSGDVTVRHP